MALLLFCEFQESVMNGQDRQPSNEPIDEPRQRRDRQMAESAQTPQATQYVDPYDMRADPQPEEPGYGHGV
jgi:hypothetical protein